MTQALKRSVHAAVVCGILLVALAGPGTAAAKPPCWKTLINDWYDTTIDGTYPIPCYQQAINHLPTDAQLYSSAKDDIRRAQQRAIALQNQSTTTTAGETTASTTAPRPTTPEPPPTTTDATTTQSEVVPPATTTSPGRPKPKGVARALDKLNPGDADSFPLPLLILGAIAILLVAAGIVGMIWRRMDRDGGDADAGAGPA